MMKVLTVAMLALSLIFGGALGAVAEEAAPAAAPAVKPAVNVGDAVQPWEAKMAVGGEMVKSSAIAGPYALVFVNSSCSSCRAELGTLAKRKKLGLEIYIVAVDANVERAVKVYQETLKIEFPILDGSDFKLADMFDFGSTPSTVIVKGGKVDARTVGFSRSQRSEIIAKFDSY